MLLMTHNTKWGEECEIKRADSTIGTNYKLKQTFKFGEKMRRICSCSMTAL